MTYAAGSETAPNAGSTTMLYFAYGSNLLVERLRLHAPSARFAGIGALAGWKRSFRLRSQDGSAKCDAVHDARSGQLHGALYDLTAMERECLDAWEGLGSMYRRLNAVVQTGGIEAEVFFYVGNQSHVDHSLRPYDWYVASLIAGVRRHQLPASIETELAETVCWKDPDPERADRNWALIPPALRRTGTGGCG